MFGSSKSFCGLVLVSLLATVVHGATTTEAFLQDPNRFFSESSPVLVVENGNFVLQLTTPLPVLCAVHVSPIVDSITITEEDVEWSVRTMDMIAPAEEHAVVLPLDSGNHSEYQVALTAFLPQPRAVLLSSTYTASITSTTASLMVDDPAGAVAPSDILTCEYDLVTTDTTAGGARLEFSQQPSHPTVHSLAYSVLGGGSDDNQTTLARGISSTTAVTDPANLQLTGLLADTDYTVDACLVDTVRSVCCTASTTFSTQPMSSSSNTDQQCWGPNLALLSQGASIADVSSNWNGQTNEEGSFGANRAIDGQPGTAWSSNQQGNDAWIAVRLPLVVGIAGVGVWSRTMGTSSEIQSFQLTLSNATTTGNENETESTIVLGPLDLPDASQLYTYNLLELLEDGIIMADTIRLDVVTSTEFNTGLHSLEVYPLVADCVIGGEPEGTATNGATELPSTNTETAKETMDTSKNGDSDTSTARSSSSGVFIPVMAVVSLLIVII